MPMRFAYLKSARVKLQERKNLCLKSTYDSAQSYAGSFLEFVKKDPVIRSITAELAAIAQQKFNDESPLVDVERRRLILPADVTERAAYQYRMLEVLVHDEDKIPHFSLIFGRGSNQYQDMFDDFFEQTLIPLCSYIDERIDDSDLLLYLLSRYQRECAWFESDSLNNLIANTESKKLEEVLDAHLRSWLFREGIDYPFSTPRSPSGRSDIVVWHGEEPLAIEVKVYDGNDRDLRHVSQGLWQAHRYSNDYGKPFGYLVVFNVSTQHLLSYETNVTGGPPCMEVGGSNIYAITINVGHFRASASKEKPLETKLVKTPSGN
jgi:hypothetical protein